MRRKMNIAVAVVCAFALTGCPGATDFELGVWLFTIEVPPDPPAGGTGLVLLQDGFTVAAPGSFPGVTNVFNGDVIWELTGNTITITQDLTTTVFLYTGTVNSPTSMSGTFMEQGDQSPSGTWSAEYGSAT